MLELGVNPFSTFPEQVEVKGPKLKKFKPNLKEQKKIMMTKMRTSRRLTEGLEIEKEKKRTMIEILSLLKFSVIVSTTQRRHSRKWRRD